jgi:hypothetical protein
VGLLERRVRQLDALVTELEISNRSLRESNRTLTKLANCAGNVGFKEVRNSCKGFEGSPNSKEIDGGLIFVDYPSCEFSLVRPSSNEV